MIYALISTKFLYVICLFFAKFKILHRKTSWYIDLAAVQSDIAAAAKKKRNR